MAEGECLLLAQFGLGQHVSGLLTGGGVHVEILEEDLGAAGGRSTALGVVLGLDVDGRGHRSVRVIEGRSLAVGAGDAVALRFGGLDDEFQVGDIAGCLCHPYRRLSVPLRYCPPVLFLSGTQMLAH